MILLLLSLFATDPCNLDEFESDEVEVNLELLTDQNVATIYETP